MPTLAYFPKFTPVGESSIKQEMDGAGTAPIDHGQDILPFDYLGGRRFEILAYRLKTLAAAGGRTVTLVQAAADRGRDVLVYDDAKLVEIIQCKNQQQKVTRPQLLHELVKLALHGAKDPAVLGNGPVHYEIWGTGDFTEPAALMLDSWPQTWKQELVRPAFDEVIETYADLNGTEWDKVRKYVLDDFPASVKPYKQTGLDVTAAVRKSSALYTQFFRGVVVMEADEVGRAIAEMLAKGGLRQVTADDMRHVLDRMEQFPRESRIYLGYGYSFGLTPAQFVLMSSDEMQQFATNCLRACLDNLRLVMDAILRQITSRMAKSTTSMQIGNGNFRYVLSQVLRLRVLSRFNKSLVPARLMRTPPDFDASGLTLDQLISRQVGLVWNDMQTIISSHERRQGEGPDELLRTAAAEFAVVGFSDKEEFDRTLQADCDKNKEAIAALDAEILALVPSDLVVISDSKIAFGDERLLNRMVESIKRLEEAQRTAGTPKAGSPVKEEDPPTAGAPRLDKVTWSKVPYREKAFHRGYNAGLIFTGYNFSPKCTWTRRGVGETSPPRGEVDYRWRDLSLSRPHHLEVSTNDDECETPLGDIDVEFCIKNPNGEKSEWRKFEYPFDFARLDSILDQSEKRGRELYAARDFEGAVEPLRKAWSMSRHIPSHDAPRAADIEKLWNSAIDEAALARLRFRAGQKVRLTAGALAGRVGAIERLHVRSRQAYQVKFEDDQTCFAADTEVEAAP